MSVATEPESTAVHRRKRMKWWLLLLLVLTIAACGAWLWIFKGDSTAESEPIVGQFYTVSPIDMDITVSKDGEIQAVNNIDIISEVEGVTTIQQIINEGTTVKKGDIVMTLDSSMLKQKIEDVTLNVQSAEAALTSAKEMTAIQRSTNDANFEGATVAVKLAELSLQQYEEGTYPQELSNAKTELDMARIALKNREDDLVNTNKLFAKGFVTEADVKKAMLDERMARNDVAKAETALRVLTKYKHQMDQASKWNDLVQAKQKLLRVRGENGSNLKQRTADEAAKDQSLALLKRRLDRLKEQFEACTIRAPADGMVVYGSTTDRNSNAIQEGAQVRERQLLIRLPDVSAMKVVVRIPESLVSKLQIGQKAMVRIVGVPYPLQATLSKIAVLADSANRWWNPDLREYPVDLNMEQTPAGLKPGGGAMADIYINHLSQVLAVPLDSVYSAGDDRYVFVRDGDQIKPVLVKVGLTNDTHAQVTSGLSSGQQILRLQTGQGRELLEKAGIRMMPTTKPSIKIGTRANRAKAK